MSEGAEPGATGNPMLYGIVLIAVGTGIMLLAVAGGLLKSPWLFLGVALGLPNLASGVRVLYRTRHPKPE